MRLQHEAPARSVRAVLVLLGAWALLAVGWWVLDAETWIVAGLALFTLPLIFELATGKTARLTLDGTTLAWHSGRLTDRVTLAEIGQARFDRRLDGSMRVTLVLRDGRKLRLPQDVVPPGDALETTLQAAGIRTERHPFTFW